MLRATLLRRFRLPGGSGGALVVGGKQPPRLLDDTNNNHHQTSNTTKRCISTEEQMKLEQEINSIFAEAREEIEAAMESIGTTYFNDDAQIAKDLTKECIERYEDLLKRCEEDVAQKEKIQRSMGLKIEQLKAECKLIDTAHDD
jgi:16S rRNA C1402 (ribose-2'-O) methylase RsmI